MKKIILLFLLICSHFISLYGSHSCHVEELPHDEYAKKRILKKTDKVLSKEVGGDDDNDS